MYRKLFMVFLNLVLIASLTFAGNYGKITGKVVDKETGEALIGASIIIVFAQSGVEGTAQGAYTNVNGEYVILNVPVGTYSLKCSQIGYQTYIVRNIRVNSDQTTSQDFRLSSQAVQVDAIEVVADKPLVQKNTTSSVSTITSEDIKNLPIRNVTDMALLSTGIVRSNAGNDASGIVIRGGRPDEVSYYIDGVNTTNRVSGGEGTFIIGNAVEEVQVLAGGYSAEYGGANSGIIKSSIKTGTNKYKASMELRTDSWAKPGKEVLNTYSYGDNDYSLQLSGPLLPNDQRFRFFVAGQYIANTNNPNWWPELDIKGLVDANINPATGLHDTIDLYWPARVSGKNWFRYQMRFNGNVLIDLKPFQIKVGGTHRYINNNNGIGFGAQYNGNRISKTEGFEQTGNLKLTHFLTPSTFYNINLNYYNRYQETYDKDFYHDFLAYSDSNAAAKYGYTMRNVGGVWTDPNSYSIWDWSFNRFGTRPTGFNKVRQTQIGGAFDLTHQIGITHEIKAGGDFTRYTFRSYALANATGQQIRNNPDATAMGLLLAIRPSNYGYDIWGNEINDGVDGARHPIFAAAYIQDKIEFSDIVLNLGLRYDYIEADGYDFVDKSNIQFDSDGLIAADQIQKTAAHSYISPRIGFSFALTDRTIFYAQWGKFVQQSKLRDMYLGRDYISRIVLGGNAYVNPVGFGLSPERTIQYDIGFKQQLGDNLGFDISAYYKDIKDQVTAALQPAMTGAQHASYYTLMNSDFATTKGIEFKLSLRRVERIASQLSYTYSDARGTGSATQYSSRFYIIWQAPAYGNELLFPTFVMPLDFNYPHKGTFYLDYRFGDNDGGPILENLGLNFLLNFNSGRTITRIDPQSSYNGSRIPQEPYGTSQTPWVYTLDLTLDKTVKLGPLSCNFYITVYNLLNRKNEVSAFLETGNASDNGYLATESGRSKAAGTGRPEDYNALYTWNNILTAGNFGNPRQIYLGLRIDF